MSTTIDHRVVEMRFDNKQFEANVSTTMSTLDKLKRSLNLSGASKGLEDINAASKKVDMSGLGRGVDTVQAKFSAMQVVAVTALANITNSAVNAGKKIANALTLEPVMTGFKEYETQINATQTILANTASKGSTIEDVNKALEELNKYADLTIYNFTEMTRNIGTFTAAGIELDTAVNAIQGIANLAAVSGSTSQQASTAMYQLSQALASGTVKLMDWNSVVNAGMGGEMFQNALKETSELLGTGAKAAIEANGSFRESLKNGWLTAEVLTETLKKFTTSGANEYVAEYTGLTKEAVEATLEAAKAQYGEADAIEHASKELAKKSGKNADEIKSMLQFAKNAEDAATKVKTFTQLWDVMKEAAQSGWSQTWKLIVGDFEQAKSLMTPIADVLTGIINGISDARNMLLKGALDTKNAWAAITSKLDAAGLGKIKEIAEAVGDVTDKLTYFQDVVNDVWRGDYFNVDTGRYELLEKAGYDSRVVQDLVNKGYQYKLTIEDIEESHKKFGLTMDKTSESTKDVTDAFNNLSDEQLKNAGLTEHEIKLYRDLEREARKSGVSIGELVDEMSNKDGRTLLIESFKNAWQGLSAVLTSVKDAWNEVIPSMSSVQLYGIIKAVNKFSQSLIVSEETADKIKRTFKGLFAIIDIVRSVIVEVAKTGFGLLSKVIGGVNVDILSTTASVGDMIVAFRDWLFDNNLIVKGIEKIVDIAKLGIETIREWINAFSEIPIVRDNIERFNSTFVNAFNEAREAITKFVDGLRDGTITFDTLFGQFSEIGGNIVDGLINGIEDHPIAKTMIEFANKILTTVKDVLGIHSPSTEFKEVGKNIIDGLIQGIQNGVSAVWTILKNIASTCVEIFNSIDFGAIIAAGFGVGILLIAKKWADVFEKFAAPFESFGDMFDGIGSFFKDFGSGLKANLKASALEKKSNALLNLAKAIGVLAVSVFILSKVDSGKIWGAVGAITVLISVITAMSIAIGQFGNTKGVLKISGFATAMIGIAAALLLLTFAMKRVSGMSPDELQKGITTITLLGMIISGLIRSDKLFTKGGSKIGGTLVKISVAILLMVGIIKLVSGMDPGELTKGILAIAAFSGILAGLVAMTKLYDPKAMFKLGSTVLAMSTALLLLVVSARLIAGMDSSKLAKGFLVIAAFSGILAGLVAMTKLYDPKAIFKLGSTVLGMSTAMLMMALVVRIVSGMDAGRLAKGVIVIAAFGAIMLELVAITRLATDKDLKRVGVTVLAMSISIGILAGISAIIGLVKTGNLVKGIIAVGLLSGLMVMLVHSTKNVNSCEKTLIAFAIGIGALAASLTVLSFIDPKKLATATIALSSAIGMFALLMHTTKSLNGIRIAPLAIMLGAIVAISGIIFGLSLMDVDSVLGTAQSISVLLLSMSASLFLISKTGHVSASAIGALALMGLVVGELAIILGLMAHFDVNPSIETAKSLSLLLMAMSAALVVLGVVGSMGPASFVGIGALATLIAGIGTLIVAIGALMDKFPKLEDFLNKGIPVLEKIGYALGSFFGNIIGGFIGNLTSGIPEIGTHLSEFMTNLQPFVDGAKAIDPAIVDSVKALAETILILTGVDVINGLTSWLTGGSSMTDFSSQLVPFGEAMRDFSAVVSGNIDEAAVKAAANAGKILAEMSSTLPNTGGIASWFAGDNKLSDFVTQLVPFGTAIAEFSSAVKGRVDEAAVTAAANSGKILAEMATAIPNSGGLKAMFAGENDMTAFANQLVPFGNAIAAFSATVAGRVDEDAVKAAVNAGKIIAKMADTIPNSGGLSELFSGNNDLILFGEQLAPFGRSIVNFSTAVSGKIDEAAVEAATNIGEIVSELANSLPNTGGMVTWFTGDNNLTAFGESLVSFGQSFAEYAGHISGINSEVVTATTAAATTLVELQNGLPKEKGLFANSTSLVDFGKTLSLFGSHFSRYYYLVSNVDVEQLSSVISQVNRLVAMAKNMVGLDTSGMSSFGSALTQLGESGIDGFIRAFHNSSARVNQAVSSMLNGFVNAANAKRAAINNVFMNLIQSALNSITNRQQVFYNAGGMLMARFTAGLKNGTTSSLQTVKQFIVTTLNTINSYDQTFVVAGEKLMVKFVEGIKSKDAKMSDSFLSTINEALVSIKGRYNAFRQAGGYLVTGFADGIKANTYKAKAQAIAMAKAAEQAAKDELGIRSPSKVFEKEVGEMIGEGTAIGIENSTSEVIKSAEEMVNEIVAASESAFDEKKFEKQIGSLIGNGIAKGVLKGSGAAANAVNKTSKQLINGSVGWIENREGRLSLIEELSAWKRVQHNYGADTEEGKKAVEQIEKLNAELSKANEDFYNGVSTALIAAKNVLGIKSPSREFAQIGRYAVEGFVNGLDNYSGDISKSTGTMAAVATEALRNSINELTSMGEQFYVLGEMLVDRMTNGMAARSDSISETFSVMMDDTLREIRSTRSHFYSAGAYLVKGFASGISENTYIAEAKARSMARAAAEAAREELDINSPSKVGRGIGNFFGIGFVKGIGDNIEKSYSAGSSIAEAARIGLSKSIAKVSNMIENGIDTEPTIRPVIDLSNVESETARLNTLFSRTQAMSISAGMAHKANAEIQNGENSAPTTGNTYTFTQNNYSPKALSRVEIYRQTKNQFSAMKGLVET